MTMLESFSVQRDSIPNNLFISGSEQKPSQPLINLVGFDESVILLNAFRQQHVLKPISDSSGRINVVPSFYCLLSPAYCIYKSYDIFRSKKEAYGLAYPSELIEIEKRTKYGKHHNCYGYKKNGEAIALDLKIDNSRFSGLDYAPDDGKLDFVISWHSDWSNYWHWHFEALPRLLLIDNLLKQNIFDFKDIRFWFVGSRPTTIQLQTIVLVLGVTPTIGYSKRGIYSYRLLHISAPYPSTFSPELVRELAIRLTIAACTDTGSHKLLVNRKDAANGRRIVNFEELSSALYIKGFKLFSPSSYSYLEQQKKFAQSHVVICPHGASSVNLLFCKTGTNVIEIHPADYIHPEPFMVAQALGLDYRFLIGSTLKGGGAISEYVVNISSVLDRLSKCWGVDK